MRLRSILVLLLALPCCNLIPDHDDGGKPRKTKGSASAAAAEDAPSDAEWSKASAEPIEEGGRFGCTSKRVRSWLRVTCESFNDGAAKPTRFELSKGKSKDVTAASSDGVGELTAHLVKGMDVAADITWQGKAQGDEVSNVVRIAWPDGKAEPNVSMDKLGCKVTPECRVNQKKLGFTKLTDTCCKPGLCSPNCDIESMLCSTDSDCPPVDGVRSFCVTRDGSRHCIEGGAPSGD